ncbi:NAD(P)/FAD-dependent oxidoreductase [Nocardioides aurantiacus]|uniref:Thioredoxin reductase n=1 Tax=Nocardioides aurantiacus TaxID=86796 RepID=A0A3N2CT62_9ACTN|nr:NAD(P)/FAD-dependent oxidoreductase [Nocardioides aurantiacus]ROR90723.1 thioredoxin reductase [Nocardioides aurantiacus]
MAAQQDDGYDVVVVGGGAAGLSGAIALARSRRRVLVVDAGAPRNAPADGVHNLLGREGGSPLELLAQGRADLETYGGEVRRGRAVGARRTPAGFEVELEDGTAVTGRRLLVTTGLVDELPDVPGLAERWVQQVLHCPFCHGWEVRDQRIGVLATGPMAVHQAVMFSRLSDRVVLLAHEVPPAEADLPRLAAAGVTVVTGRVRALEGEPGRLSGVRLEDGTQLSLDAVVVAPRMVARSAVLDAVGLDPVAHPTGMGEHYPADPTGRTSVEGVFLAGNVADLTAQVGASGAAGTTAGAMIHAELIEAELAALLPA